MHKNALFLLKNCKNPDPLASGGLGAKENLATPLTCAILTVT